MANSYFGKKGIFPFFLTLSFLVSTPNIYAHKWKLAPQSRWHKAQRSEHWILTPSQPLREMGMEIIQSESEALIYLNVSALSFPIHDDDIKVSEVKLIVNDNETHFLANRLEGGQKLLIPIEVSREIMFTLNNNTDLTLVCGRYHCDCKSSEVKFPKKIRKSA